MKVSIEVGKGWCAAQAKCNFCGYEFTLVRQRSTKANLCKCRQCNQIATIKEQETPWVGVIEEVVNDG